MTAQEVNARENITSYAAALASGSRPPQTHKVDLPAKTLANGVPEPAAGASTPHAPSSSDPRLKPPAVATSSAPEATRHSTATIGGGGGSTASTTTATTASAASRCDDDAAVAHASNEEKSNGWEGNSQTSSHKSSGADTSRTTESVQPAVNCWTKRQEELAAKPKSSSPPVIMPPSVSPAPTSKSSSSEKGQSAVKKDEKERTKDSDPTDAKDHKKSSDEVPAKRVPRRGLAPENDVAALPPPVTDTSLWPTPDLAQGEFKRERGEKEKEKEKEKSGSHVGRGGNKTWLPVPIDPPYVPPVQTKSGRGMRATRGSREGGRGRGVMAGGTAYGERAEKAGPPGAGAGANAGTGAGAGADGDRGRQYSSPHYQGGKGPKRSTSTGGPVQRRESRVGLTNGTTGERRNAGEWATETGPSGAAAAAAATQTDRMRPGRPFVEDAADARHYSDGQRSQANGFGHHPSRPDRNGWYADGHSRESDSSAPPPYVPRERGSERGRPRGRGSYRDYGNGHAHANHAANSQYSQSVNGQQQYAQHHQSRGGGSYGRRGGHAAYHAPAYRFNPAIQQPQPTPQFATYGSPYDYAVMPSGFPPAEFHALIVQMNYYFSVENLLGDFYLRKHMDNDGFVRLSFFMGFPRVQLHTKDIAVVREACQMSSEIQLQYGLDDYYVRKADGWENWVLKEEARDESARREQSDWHIDPRQRRHNGPTPPGEMSGSAEPFFPGSSQMVPHMYYQAQPLAGMNLYGYPAQPTALSATVAEFSPAAVHGHEGGAQNAPIPYRIADECPDSEVDSLVVVVKRPATGDGASVSPELGCQLPNGVSDTIPVSEHGNMNNGDGAFDDAERNPQPNGAVATHRSHRSQSDIGWFNSPRTAGPVAEPNMSHRSYTEVRAQAMKQRDPAAGTLKSNNDMITLYKFWSHFLVKRFNSAMYKEFKQYALHDADLSSRHGIEEMFKLYERSFKDRSTVGFEMIRDFVELVKLESRHGESLGIEKLKWSLASPNIRDDYKNTIENLLDKELRDIMTCGVAKNSRSPAAEPYTSAIAA